MDGEARSLGRKDAALFQAAAYRVREAMIFLPGKRDGQAPIQVLAVIGEPQKIRRRPFQII